jgi:hypothetical protein
VAARGNSRLAGYPRRAARRGPPAFGRLGRVGFLLPLCDPAHARAACGVLRRHRRRGRKRDWLRVKVVELHFHLACRRARGA